MLSRRTSGRNYGVARPGVVQIPGTAHTGPQGISPISRPASSPSPGGAPQYLTTHPAAPVADPRAALPQGGTTALSLPRAQIPADMTNRASWQRPYALGS